MKTNKNKNQNKNKHICYFTILSLLKKLSWYNSCCILKTVKIHVIPHKQNLQPLLYCAHAQILTANDPDVFRMCTVLKHKPMMATHRKRAFVPGTDHIIQNYVARPLPLRCYAFINSMLPVMVKYIILSAHVHSNHSNTCH